MKMTYPILYLKFEDFDQIPCSHIHFDYDKIFGAETKLGPLKLGAYPSGGFHQIF
jgi:hypothetical protein